MASFVEQATLRVNDQSSAAIRKINAELRQMQALANSLRNIRINIRINTGQLQAANQQLNALAHNLRQASRIQITPQVNTAGLQRAQRQLSALRTAAARPITVTTAVTGGLGGPPAPPTPGRRGRGRGARQPGGGELIPRGDFRTLRGAASVIIGGTAYAIAANVTRAMKEGILEVDAGYTSLYLKQLDRVYGKGALLTAEGMLNAAQAQANMMPAGGAFWNLGQRAKNFSEALGFAQHKDLSELDELGRTRSRVRRTSGLPDNRQAIVVDSHMDDSDLTL